MYYITKTEQPRNIKEYIIIREKTEDARKHVSSTTDINKATKFKTKSKASYAFNRHRLYQYYYKMEEIKEASWDE